MSAVLLAVVPGAGWRRAPRLSDTTCRPAVTALSRELPVYENMARATGVELGGWSFGGQFGDLNNEPGVLVRHTIDMGFPRHATLGAGDIDGDGARSRGGELLDRSANARVAGRLDESGEEEALIPALTHAQSTMLMVEHVAECAARWRGFDRPVDQVMKQEKP